MITKRRIQLVLSTESYRCLSMITLSAFALSIKTTLTSGHEPNTLELCINKIHREAKELQRKYQLQQFDGKFLIQNRIEFE